MGPISTVMRPCKDDNGSELIGYFVEKCDTSRYVWQCIEYNDPHIFTHTDVGFTEVVVHHFYVYAENCVEILPTLTTFDPIIEKSSYTHPDIPEGSLLTKFFHQIQLNINDNRHY
ncbi:unnamed protein product [Rotaria sordida]|uniref:Uncharacterized protein n=1 Tax=Rotaria sordida TaxID=392033 RepID=A0A815INI2_9BILA|nr:unnamed protein product [Rotaria sordida]CAF1368664.1 unnamed protein product [Rotaria sordida]CAF1369293.1 unnamed protein product [Rotaria sordida]CAF1435423.1 unnamed protein product [Rotaria sordida]CAF1528318.1 unnamed protein product [Rotaria sordida]